MKRFFRNYILLLTLMLLSVTNARTQEPVYITPSMALKISYLFRGNTRMNLLAYHILETNSFREVDIALRSLPNDLILATKFLDGIARYCGYDEDHIYPILNLAGFTLQEHQLAEEIISIEWEKSRQRRIAQEEQEQRERMLKAQQERIRAKQEQEKAWKSFLANQDTIFPAKSVQPARVFIDAQNLLQSIEKRRKAYSEYEPIDCRFDFVTTKDGKMYLAESEDSTEFSATDIFIYDYIKNNYVVQQVAQKQFNLLDTTVKVNATLKMHVFEESIKNHKTIKFFAARANKKSDWIIEDSVMLKQQLSVITSDRLDDLYRDVANLLSTQKPFISKKGRYRVNLNVTEHRLYCRAYTETYTGQHFVLNFVAIPN